MWFTTSWDRRTETALVVGGKVRRAGAEVARWSMAEVVRAGHAARAVVAGGAAEALDVAERLPPTAAPSVGVLPPAGVSPPLPPPIPSGTLAEWAARLWAALAEIPVPGALSCAVRREETDVRYNNSGDTRRQFRATVFSLHATLLRPSGPPVDLRLDDGSLDRLADRAVAEWRWRASPSTASAPDPTVVVLTGQATRAVLDAWALALVGAHGPATGFPPLGWLLDDPTMPDAPGARPFDDLGFPTLPSPLAGPWVGREGQIVELGHARVVDGRVTVRPSVLTIAAGAPTALPDHPALVIEAARIINDPGAEGILHLLPNLAWSHTEAGTAPLEVPPVLSGHLQNLSVLPVDAGAPVPGATSPPGLLVSGLDATAR